MSIPISIYLKDGRRMTVKLLSLATGYSHDYCLKLIGWYQTGKIDEDTIMSVKKGYMKDAKTMLDCLPKPVFKSDRLYRERMG